jgi:CheY-like chemotaxis protein
MARAGSMMLLIAEDDEDDRMLAMDALEDSELRPHVRFVEDGEQLMEYLRSTGAYAGQELPRPGVILLDLNMPRKDGREALREIKNDPVLRAIPVVILTTSQDQDDISSAYALGGSSYITKPVSFDGLVEVMRALERYWFGVVALP